MPSTQISEPQVVVHSPVRFIYLGFFLVGTSLFALFSTSKGNLALGATLTLVCLVGAVRSVHAGTCSVAGGEFVLETLIRTRHIPRGDVSSVSRATWALAYRRTCPTLELADGTTILLREFSNHPSVARQSNDRTAEVIRKLASVLSN